MSHHRKVAAKHLQDDQTARSKKKDPKDETPLPMATTSINYPIPSSNSQEFVIDKKTGRFKTDAYGYPRKLMRPNQPCGNTAEGQPGCR